MAIPDPVGKKTTLVSQMHSNVPGFMACRKRVQKAFVTGVKQDDQFDIGKVIHLFRGLWPGFDAVQLADIVGVRTGVNVTPEEIKRYCPDIAMAGGDLERYSISHDPEYLDDPVKSVRPDQAYLKHRFIIRFVRLRERGLVNIVCVPNRIRARFTLMKRHKTNHFPLNAIDKAIKWVDKCERYYVEPCWQVLIRPTRPEWQAMCNTAREINQLSDGAIGSISRYPGTIHQAFENCKKGYK